MNKKRARSIYHAVVKGNEVITEVSLKKFLGELAKYKERDIIFACRGTKLDLSITTQPIVELNKTGV